MFAVELVCNCVVAGAAEPARRAVEVQRGCLDGVADLWDECPRISNGDRELASERADFLAQCLDVGEVEVSSEGSDPGEYRWVDHDERNDGTCSARCAQPRGVCLETEVVSKPNDRTGALFEGV